MGLIKGVVLAGFFCLSSSLFAKEVDVGVDHIQDPMTVCHCENPGQVGRICISIHKWRAPELTLIDEALATKFIPSIQNNEFFLFSEAFYSKCQYGLSLNNITDPVEQARDNAKGLRFDHAGYRGKEPLMKATVLSLDGNGLAHSDFVAGQFYYQEVYFNKGKPLEFFRVMYPGQTTIKFPLDKILTKEQIRRILDKDDSELRFVKAILAVATFEGNTKAFGEYLVTLRFHRKKEITLTQVQKDPWNTAFIGIGVENEK